MVGLDLDSSRGPHSICALCVRALANTKYPTKIKKTGFGRSGLRRQKPNTSQNHGSSPHTHRQPQPAPLRPQALFIVMLGMFLLMAGWTVVVCAGRTRPHGSAQSGCAKEAKSRKRGQRGQKPKQRPNHGSSPHTHRQPQPAPLRPQALFIVMLGMFLLMAGWTVVVCAGRTRPHGSAQSGSRTSF